MSNTFLTVQEIAQESLMRLQNQLVMGGLVHRDHSSDFASKGDTVQVKKPASFVANDFAASGETSAQDIVEQNVLVKLDRIADVTVDVTSKELTLNVEDFGEQVIEGAMQALAQKIDKDLCDLFTNVPYYSGTAGTTPAALADIAGVRKVLNDHQAPFGNRSLVVDTAAEAKLIVLDALVNSEKAGSTEALREANLGKVYGFGTYMSQNIGKATGALADKDSTNKLKVKTAAAAGATSIVITNAKGTIKAGDVIIIGGKSYSITTDATIASDEATVTINPGLVANAAADAAITSLAAHTANLAFHKNGLALVNRPLALPLGGADGYIANYDGLSVRVTMGYNMATKKNTISFDILYGVKVLDENLVARLLG